MATAPFLGLYLALIRGEKMNNIFFLPRPREYTFLFFLIPIPTVMVTEHLWGLLLAFLEMSKT